MNEDEIKELQTTLAKDGFLEESDIDGKLGPKTKAALKEWQKWRVNDDTYIIDRVFPYGYSTNTSKNRKEKILGAVKKYSIGLASGIPFINRYVKMDPEKKIVE